MKQKRTRVYTSNKSKRAELMGILDTLPAQSQSPEAKPADDSCLSLLFITFSLFLLGFFNEHRWVLSLL